jgi:hypothetical protein
MRIASRSAGAGLGHHGVLFTLRNDSSSSCQLFGYVGMQLLGTQANPLPTTVTRGGNYLFPAITPHTVALAPGGFAAFDLGYGANPAGPGSGKPYAVACPAARQAEITLPGAYDHSVAATGIAPCGGYVTVSPVVPGKSWIGFAY